jgi:phosphorylcholine metabolism protein LicD
MIACVCSQQYLTKIIQKQKNRNKRLKLQTTLTHTYTRWRIIFDKMNNKWEEKKKKGRKHGVFINRYDQFCSTFF